MVQIFSPNPNTFMFSANGLTAANSIYIIVKVAIILNTGSILKIRFVLAVIRIFRPGYTVTAIINIYCWKI